MAEDTSNSESEDDRGSRLRSYLFVAFFIISVLGLLTGYRYAIPTTENDWYLFQVARHTTWLLDKIGHSATLEKSRSNELSPAETRAHLAAFSREESAASPSDMAAASNDPLTAWERFSFRAQQARRTNPQGPIGPQVTFVLRPNTPIRVQELEQAVAELEELGDPAFTTELEALKAERDSLTAAQREFQEKSARAVVLDRKSQQTELSAEETLELDQLRAETVRDRAYVFVFIVVPECGAIEVMAIFFAAVIAFPTLWSKRLLGILLGVPIMYLVNVFRLSCLAVIGALDGGGKWFNFSHLYVWQAIYIVFVVAVWLAWVEYIVRRRPMGEGLRRFLRQLAPAQARRRSIIALGIKFLIFAPVLTILWWYALPAYGWVLVQVSGSILRYLLGIPIEAGEVVTSGLFNTGSSLLFYVKGISRELHIAQLVTNVPPYVALVLATSGLAFWRRIRILLYGVGILCLSHVTYIVVIMQWQDTLMEASEVPVAVIQFFLTLPFLLWIVFAYWDRIVGRNGAAGIAQEKRAASSASDHPAPPPQE